jgi:ketosteroid isomerase-like protein
VTSLHFHTPRAMLARLQQERFVRTRTLNTSALLLIAVSTACTVERTPTTELPDPESVSRAEIAATLHNYTRAMVEGDPRRVASFFTPTAHLYLPDVPDIVGRGPIDQIMTATFADGRVIDVALDTELIDIGTGIAHQFGSIQQRVRDADGGERTLRGRFVIRWLKGAESSWRIEHFMLNDAPPDTAQATLAVEPADD